jgi:hypothetical protein
MWVGYSSNIVCYSLDGSVRYTIQGVFDGMVRLLCCRNDKYLVVMVGETVILYAKENNSYIIRTSLFDRCTCQVSDNGLEILSFIHDTNRLSRFDIPSCQTIDSLLFTDKPDKVIALGRIGLVTYCLSADGPHALVFHLWKVDTAIKFHVPTEERYPLPPNISLLLGPSSQVPSLVSATCVYGMAAFFFCDDFPDWYVSMCRPISTATDSDAWRLLHHRPRSIYVRFLDPTTAKSMSLLSLALSRMKDHDRFERIRMIRVLLTLPLYAFPTIHNLPSLLRAAIDLEDLRLVKEVLEKYSLGRIEHNTRVKNSSHVTSWRLSVLDIDSSEEFASCLCDVLGRYPDVGIRFLQEFGLMLMENVDERNFHLRARGPASGMMVTGCAHVSVNDGFMKCLRKSPQEVTDRLGTNLGDIPIRLPHHEEMHAPIQSIDCAYVGICNAAGILSNGDTLLAALVRTNDVNAFDNDVAQALVQHQWQAYARTRFIREFALYIVQLMLLVIISFVDDTHISSSFPSSIPKNQAVSAMCFLLIPFVIWSLWIEAMQLFRLPQR